MNASQAPPEPGPEAEANPETPAPAPPPEPWTPERVTAWNAYYDLYVAAGVLVMGFLTSVVRVSNSAIWTHLRAGQLILGHGPLTTDPFSYTEAGRRWVDIPWLFQASAAGLYGLGALIFPGDLARGDRVGVMVLVAANALVRALTILVLMLGLRRPGPGLWWVAVCAALALEGLAGPAPLAPESWGMLLLAVELVLLHRAMDPGRKGAAGWELVPLFLLWANVDASFLIGLLVLAGAAIGALFERKGEPGKGAEVGSWTATPRVGLMVLGASAAACLVNPSFVRAYATADATIFANQFSPLWLTIRILVQGGNPEFLGVLAGYFLIFVGLGLASFAVNRRRFSWPRFLMFAVMAVLCAISYYGLKGWFALVLAATLATNGQEWYQGRFGRSGRLGAGWAAWSVGGRAVTIILLFAVIARSITGLGASPGDPVFGFGFNPDDFAFEAADFLGKAPIGGRVLNTTPALGDALIWRARGSTLPRQTFIDSREGVFPASLDAELRTVRRALVDDKGEQWKPILNHYKVDVVMLNVNPAQVQTLGDASTRTFPVLMASKDWIPFYDDGNVALFGRADAPKEDLAFFEANRLEARLMAFRRESPIPQNAELPTKASRLEAYFRGRALMPMQPHARAAHRWLYPPVIDPSASPPLAPDMARCLVAVREARAAVASRPEDAASYRILAEAYKDLMIQESAILSANRENPAGAGLPMRLQQRVTALNFAIQSTPPPGNNAARESLRNLNLELAQLYDVLGALDLERDRLVAVKELSQPGEFSADELKRLDQLDAVIEEVRAKMEEFAGEPQGGAYKRIDLAQRRGMLGMVITELEDVEKQGINPAQVRARLVDLLCQVGQIDKAQEILNQGETYDPALETEPGMSFYRHARVYLLLGHYEGAKMLYQKALTRLRETEVRRALESAVAETLAGDVKGATRAAMEMPSLLGNQAAWEAELGLLLLEAGEPRAAGDELTRSLTLGPNLAIRPLVVYDLEQMGRHVPGELPEDVFAK